MPVQRVPVGLRALMARIKRKFASADQGHVLKAARGAQAHQDLGNFYVLDGRRNTILHKHVDPETLGRDLGVLHAHEKLVE